jgi:hypothetical protein
LVEEAPDQIRRSSKIPVERGAPGFNLFVEQLREVRGSEFAQIDQSAKDALEAGSIAAAMPELYSRRAL